MLLPEIKGDRINMIKLGNKEFKNIEEVNKAAEDFQRKENNKMKKNLAPLYFKNLTREGGLLSHAGSNIMSLISEDYELHDKVEMDYEIFRGLLLDAFDLGCECGYEAAILLDELESKTQDIVQEGITGIREREIHGIETVKFIREKKEKV